MADEIIEELWKIKDQLGREAGEDLQAFCRQLNKKALERGFQMVDRSCSPQMMVAEDPVEYKTRVDSE
jgi:hypothetical protein